MIASILLVLAIIIAIYAKFYRAKLFGKILENFVRRLNPVFATGKEQLFNEGFKKVNRTNLNSPFKVLEIGVGTGSNFKFYPNNCDLTISDKSDEFVSYLKKSLQEMKREDLVINNFLVADAQNMKNIESNHFDVVVATFTLCSVDNFESVLNEIHRVLRPTGVFLFMVKLICYFKLLIIMFVFSFPYFRIIQKIQKIQLNV